MDALSKKLAELSTNFEQLTILSDAAKTRFMSEFCAVQVALEWSPNSAPPEYQDDPFRHAYMFIHKWASDSVKRLRTIFMELLKSDHPRVDAYSIEDTVRQIKLLVGFLAFQAIDALKFARKRTRSIAQVNMISPKRAAGQIVSDLNLHLVLWTDEFRAWAEPLRPVHIGPLPNAVVSATTHSEPESNLQENDVPAASTESHGAQRPAWERLVLKESKSGDNSATLDDQTYRLGEPAFKMLSMLQQAKGEPIKCNFLQSKMGRRPSDVYKKFPDELQAIDDMPGRKGQAAFMR